MQAKLIPFLNRCIEHTPCGDVVERTGSCLVQTLIVEVDGQRVFRGKEAETLAYCEKNGYEVDRAN